MKILIADDDRTVHVSFTKYLTEKGFDVLHAYDGVEALRLAQEHLPDFLLLDIMMPGKDGRDVCRELKNSATTDMINIIMFTSKDQQHDRLVGLDAGADEYLTKPCPVVFLELALKKLLRKKGLADFLE